MNNKVAAVLAKVAHHGQVDKQGEPYLDHVYRVAAYFLNDSIYEQVAWLHDIVEDTPVTKTDLRAMGFATEVVDAVGLLTRHKGEPYSEYIDRILYGKGVAGTVARTVKIMDLTDNMRQERGPIALSLLERYERALYRLRRVEDE